MNLVYENIKTDCQELVEKNEITFMNQKKEQIYINSFFGVLVGFCLMITLIIISSLASNHQNNWYKPLLLTSAIIAAILFAILLLIYFFKMKFMKNEKKNQEQINQQIQFAKYYQQLNYQMNQEVNQQSCFNNFTQKFQDKELFFQKGLGIQEEDYSAVMNDFYFKEKKKWTLNNFDYQNFSYFKIKNSKIANFSQEDTTISVEWELKNGKEINHLHIESKTTENDWSILVNPNLQRLLSNYFTKNYYFRPQLFLHQNEILMIVPKMTGESLHSFLQIDQIESVFSLEEMATSIFKKIEEKNLEMKMYLDLAQLFFN